MLRVLIVIPRDIGSPTLLTRGMISNVDWIKRRRKQTAVPLQILPDFVCKIRYGHVGQSRLGVIPYMVCMDNILLRTREWVKGRILAICRFD